MEVSDQLHDPTALLMGKSYDFTVLDASWNPEPV